MTRAPANVFCASTLFHLLVLQALAAERAEAGERNVLVLTRPMLRDREQHVDSFAPYRRLLLNGLWDAVLADDALTHNYDLRSLQARGASFAAAVRAARAQRRLDAFVAAARPVRAVYVTNPMTNAVDRRAASWGRRRGAAVDFVEDGTGSYLAAELKHSIDRSYWTVERGRGDWAGGAVGALLRLDRGALAPPPPFDADLAFDATHVLFPDRFPATPLTGLLMPLSRARLRATIESLRDRVEVDLPPPQARGRPLSVYLSRPDSEDGLLAADDEVRLVGDALRELSRAGRVVLKPHPRDRCAKVAEIAARSGVEVVDSDPHPAELFLDVTRAAACYGTWSGSLVYARELLGIPAHSLLPRFCDRLAELGRPSHTLRALAVAIGGLFPELFDEGRATGALDRAREP